VPRGNSAVFLPKKELCCQKRNHSLELNSSVFLKIVSNIQSGSLSEIAQSQADVRGARFTSQYILCASQIGPLGKILFHFFTLTSSLQETTVLVLYMV